MKLARSKTARSESINAYFIIPASSGKIKKLSIEVSPWIRKLSHYKNGRPENPEL